MHDVVTRPGHPDVSAGAVRQAVLQIADCRSLPALRDALFSHADGMIGGVAMGIYVFDRAEELRHVASRFAPQGFLDQYDREYRRIDPMLDCIVSQRRTVDGFSFHGPAGWPRCGNHDILRDWGFHHNIGGPLVINGRTAGRALCGDRTHRGPVRGGPCPTARSDVPRRLARPDRDAGAGTLARRIARCRGR